MVEALRHKTEDIVPLNHFEGLSQEIIPEATGKFVYESPMPLSDDRNVDRSSSITAFQPSPTKDNPESPSPPKEESKPHSEPKSR